MATDSRRAFWSKAAGAAALLGTAEVRAEAAAGKAVTESVSLNGDWDFRIGGAAWKRVSVPHTWQVAAGTAGYLGKASYRRSFDVPAEWKGSAVRVEFESVFHTARVSVNGKPAGEHIGKGYTAFTLDITDLLDYGQANTLQVEADNSFDANMLPRKDSYDWTPDGGICRPVWLHVTPPIYIERVEVDATPDLAAGTAKALIRGVIRNRTSTEARVTLHAEIIDDATGLIVARSTTSAVIPAVQTLMVEFTPVQMENVKLWHFDHPNLYRVAVNAGAHRVEDTFGVRSIEVKSGAFYLNGERVWLMGVERMAGSHPLYGMAEPSEWIDHDHRDMKELNCVFTRVHWQQDQRVLDWCDRHGMLMQLEVPTWGGATWEGMIDEPSRSIMLNGLEQLREMIEQNRNHPSIFCWGLCNEIGGDRHVPKKFAQTMLGEAKRLDPARLRSYASNSLHGNTAADVAGEMDILEWNEYYESWYGGTLDSVRQSLKKIRSVYPDKMIVISEYGLCECNPRNPTSDERRIEILKSHDAVYREEPLVGGLIFFCYNDYRTHIGDKGIGVMKQRVHGVVDLLGTRKPSYQVLRRESSPVESLSLSRTGGVWTTSLKTRTTVPAYTLRGYTLRWTVYAFGRLPMEQLEVALPDLAPGSAFTSSPKLQHDAPLRVVVEIVRPTGSSVLSEEWQA